MNKLPVIMLIDIEQNNGKIQHIFMIQSLNKLDIEGTYLIMIKAISYPSIEELMLLKWLYYPK